MMRRVTSTHEGSMANRYLLVARDTGDWATTAASASPEEIQAIIGRYIEWSSRLAEQGKLLSGEKLKDGEGRVLSGRGSSLRVTDGPHAESKEVLGGFWLLQADSYDEAVRLAAECPHLDFGSLELREIEETP
jgi:hypothetical protein